MVMIPVIQFDGLQPPEKPGEATELSGKIGEALADILGHEPVRADHALEALAIWVGMIIKVHPSTEDWLAEHFNEFLSAEMRRGTRQ